MSRRRPFRVIPRTRAQLALELLERLQRGPSFDVIAGLDAFTPEEARRRYRAWFESWIDEDLRYLVPELRKGPR
jgi:hypothetical protein